jgi:hypothetical protein
MRLSSVIFGILMVGTLIVGMYSFVSDLSGADAYNIEYDTQYEEAFDKSEEVSEQINESYTEMQEFSASKSSTIGIVTLVPDMLILLKNMIVLPFSLAGGMIGSLIQYMGLPSWVQSFLIAGLTILFLFAIAALILRYKYT